MLARITDRFKLSTKADPGLLHKARHRRRVALEMYELDVEDVANIFR